MADSDLIIAIGRALWGEPGWQAKMADALGVSRDSVQDWRQGRSTPRAGVWRDLARIAAERGTEIEAARALLSEKASP